MEVGGRESGLSKGPGSQKYRVSTGSQDLSIGSTSLASNPNQLVPLDEQHVVLPSVKRLMIYSEGCCPEVEDRHQRLACNKITTSVWTPRLGRYLPIPPRQCLLGPSLIVEEVDNVLVENVSVETAVLGRPCLLAVEDVAALVLRQMGNENKEHSKKRTRTAMYAIFWAVTLFILYKSARHFFPGSFPEVFFKAVRGPVNTCLKHFTERQNMFDGLRVAYRKKEWSTE